MSVYVATQCVDGVRDVAEAVDQLRAMGVNHIELSGPHRPLDGAHLERLSRPSQRYILHNYFPAPPDPFFLNLASANPDVAQRSVIHVRRALELARALGASLYSVHGGFRCDPDLDLRFYPKAGMESHPKALQRYIDVIGPLADLAKDLGVILAVENNVMDRRNLAKSPEDPFLLFMGPDDFKEMFRSVSSSALGALIDVGHLKVTSTTFGWDAQAILHDLAPSVVALHVHDNDGRTDQHQPPTPASWFMSEIRRGPLADVPQILETIPLDEPSLRAAIGVLANGPDELRGN